MLVRLYFSVSSYCLRNSASRCVRSMSESSRRWGQRVDGMYGICLYLALEDVLDIHDIEVLSVHQLLEGIYAQGILHYLGTDFTVHISRQVVAQRGEGYDQGGDEKQYEQHGEQYGQSVQLGYAQRDDILKGISFVIVSLYLNLMLLQNAFSSFLFHTSSVSSKAIKLPAVYGDDLVLLVNVYDKLFLCRHQQFFSPDNLPQTVC